MPYAHFVDYQVALERTLASHLLVDWDPSWEQSCLSYSLQRLCRPVRQAWVGRLLGFSVRQRTFPLDGVA